MVVFGKVVVFGQSGCSRAKVVVFGRKYFLIGQSGCIRAKWLYSGKVVVFWENVVVFGQKDL